MAKYSHAERTVEIPEKVTISLKDNIINVTGPKGTNEREFKHPKLEIKIGKKEVTVFCLLPKRAEYALTGTWASHIKNMATGVVDGYEYTLKIVYSHFPIKTAVKGDQLFIENFLGENFPRKARIMYDTKVKVSGDQISVEGINKEHVAQTAANIEKATDIKKFDTRVFQDGIYLIDRRV